MKQPEDLLKDVDGGYLFTMTGKFGAKAALRALDRGSKCFLLALRDVGGETPDSENDHALWGMSCKLPGARSFRMMRNCMARCGWIRIDVSGANTKIVMTEKGYEKCAEFQKQLRKGPPDDARDRDL